MNLMPQIIILMNYWVSICPGSGKMCLVFLASYPMKFLIKCHTFSGQHHGEIQKGQVSCETPINLSSVLESDSCLTSLLCFLFFLNKKHTLCFLIWEIEPSLRTLTSPPPFRQLFGRQKPSLHIFSLAKVAAAMMEEPKSGARKSCCSEFEGTHWGLAGCLIPRAPGNMINFMMNVCLIVQSKSKGFFAKSQFSRVYKLFGWT